MTTAKSGVSAYVARQGASTLDGSEDHLYFLCDPLTGLRVRLTAPAAHVFTALRELADPTAANVQRFLAGNYDETLSLEAVERQLRLFRSVDLHSETRTHASQLSAIEGQRAQEKKAELVRRLPTISANVPFYGSYAPVETFGDLPIIGKTELREHLHRLHVPHEAARYVWMSSSGTTGERVQAPHVPEHFHDGVLPHFANASSALDSDSHWGLFMPAECGGLACNMNPDSPMEERITGSQLLAPQLGNPSISRIPLLERCANDMAKWDPAVLSGAPSFLYAFARYAESVGLKLPKLRAIFYHVEPASLVHKRKIESVFGVQGRSLYIASELGWLASERLPGRLFASSTDILEVIRDGKPAAPGEIGNVVVTRERHGSPVLLRYDTRDLARLNDDGVTLGPILGRPHTGVVRRPDGQEVGVDLLDRAIADAAGPAISFYRLFRRGRPSSPRFVLDVCPSNEGDVESILPALGEAVRELLGVAPDIRKTNGIAPHRGGRMPLFLDEGE